MTQQPLCFVVMPDEHGGSVDFEAVYTDVLAPAIRDARLDPQRADREPQEAVFERLILADYAIVDLTSATANVVYELGVRHAMQPSATVLVSADVVQLPFDLAPTAVLRYSLDGHGRPAAPDRDRAALVEALVAAREARTGIPVFRLLDDRPQPEIDRLRTDLFREQADYSAAAKERLAAARANGVEALRAQERELGRFGDLEAGVLVDLLLSYRATKAWADMIRLAEVMPEPVRRTRLVREQYGLALNRSGHSQDAERVLREVIDAHGPSSETYSLLGRVYKDRWEAERHGSQLEQAIDAYRRGFEADWRDAYPGVNAITLMEIRDPRGEEQHMLLPVAAYANRRRIEGGAPDYWDHAARLELGVVCRDHGEAIAGANAALASVREPWEPEATAYNLSLIRESRRAREETISWADEIERELLAAGARDEC